MAREAYNVIVLGGPSLGIAILAGIVLFDLVGPVRGYCRSLCPVGAFLSILGRHRLLRVSMDREKCCGCGACNKACMFALAPMSLRVKDLGGRCNNCGECVAACPRGALGYSLAPGGFRP